METKQKLDNVNSLISEIEASLVDFGFKFLDDNCKFQSTEAERFVTKVVMKFQKTYEEAREMAKT